MKTSLTAAACVLCWGSAAAQSDMTLTPATGGALVIQTPAGQPALAVQPTGAVQLPQLAGSPPATSGTPLCLDSSSALVACSGSALIGPQGPQGDPGTNGTNGVNGAPGAPGKSAVLTVTPEPAGAHCATGGQKVEAGVEGGAPQVRYICNGVQGPQGPQGETGPAGAPGTGGGATGLSEARHGCFDGSGTVQSGGGYSVTTNAGVYTLSFNPVPGAGSYTVLLDGRTSTGRALALSTSGSVGTGLTLTPGWLDAGGETIARICFMLVR